MTRYFLVALGGAAGALARYLLGTAIMNRFAGRFPLGTVIINISGSFLIGILMTVLSKPIESHLNLRLALVVGVLGGYTTFSSFEWETAALAREGFPGIALLNVIGSVVAGYVAVWLGIALAKLGGA